MAAIASPTRRSLLVGVAAAAGCGAGWGCSWSRRSEQPVHGRPKVGFLRQTDAASLLMADELAGFAKNGLAPVLYRGASPAELTERLLLGELVAAQLPASLALVPSSSEGGDPALLTLMVLSQNGAAVTLGKEFCRDVKFLDLAGLKQALMRRPRTATAPATESAPSVVFAVPVIGGIDDLWLRYLLAAAGVPRERVRVVAATPERMLADLREERIVGFAAPDPWPALAVAQDLGFTFATIQDICRRAPGSALVTTPRALAEHRSELKSLIRATLEASVWLDVAANRSRPLLGETLARRQNLDLDPGPIRARLGGVYDLGCRLGERDFEDDMLSFHRAGRVNLPLRADVCLYRALLARFGLASPVTDVAALTGILRDDLYREVARETGVALPDDMKPFIVTLDSIRFDPNRPGDWPQLWAAAR